VLLDALLRRRRVVVFAALALLALVVLTGQVRAPGKRRIGWIGVAVETAVAPVATALSRVSDAVDAEWALLTQIGTLRTENARLTDEVARLRQENAKLRESAQDADHLRRLLGFKEPTYRTVAARVIGRDPSHWFNTLLVDRGAVDGVHRNDAAVTSDGLVGHVIETSGSWARVLLVLDPRSAVGVLVGRSRDAGVAEGQGQVVLHVKYLSRDADVHPGDAVITAGLGEIYPRGLPVGQVIGVSRSEGDLFQEALVRPSADLNHIEEMLLLASQTAPPVP
jgi:rod shape-determining protein MreC